MEIAIVFAVVFIPFFLFVFFVWRAGRKMPESALAHLEKSVYRVDTRKSLPGKFFLWLYVGIPVAMVVFAGGLIVSLKADPVYILPGIKECLVGIYLLLFIAPTIALGIVSTHNMRKMESVVLALDPSAGTIDWEFQDVKYSLFKDDFVEVNEVSRGGKFPEMVSEYVLKNGEKLYLTFSHRGYQALDSMLKDLPRTKRSYFLPIVPVDVPPILRIAKKGADVAIRYFLMEAAGIIFLLLCIFALHYYEKGIVKQNSFLFDREVKVVGNHMQTEVRNRRYYVLLVSDGKSIQPVAVPGKLYKEGVKNRSVRLSYNQKSGQYLYKVTDFGFYHVMTWILGISVAFLFGRIGWLWQKRRDHPLS